MATNAEKQIIASIIEFVKDNSENSLDVAVSEKESSLSIRTKLKCRHTEGGLPVSIYINEAERTVNVKTYFFFTIPSLTLYDEYELTKVFNNMIDCFKTIISRVSDKTLIEMKWDYPYPPNCKDIGLPSIQILERIIPSIDRFLEIYDDYRKEADLRVRRMKELDIAILSQYRKKPPIV